MSTCQDASLFTLRVTALWAIGVTAAFSQTSAPAPDIGVGVELVLAVDASRSIDYREQMIQRRGYAEAFRSGAVQNAILNGGWGRVAITYVEWAGVWSQSVMIPWTLIDSRAAAEAFAAEIEAGPPNGASRTSISAAIDFSVGLFDKNGFSGLRRVIDISGDGPNNQGRDVAEARDAAIARGITINGLPLMTNDPDMAFGGWGDIADLDKYYADCVIGGPGSFLIPVTDWEQFAGAVQRKLVLELAGDTPGPGPEMTAGPERLIRIQASASDCRVGERMWEDRQRRWGNE
ncbi:DUF1194 domain-containing protein [Sinirhodobacter populi]|uniref:DUF1194 domain-containing protein n=1 Tax=Paenirhodobacter populi TaxID=2306993 RepID=A0A443K2R6_9RHOB|nr:DUF1194 domain-containing protein [Sinirhodobacter populi]RWR27032.1 DUF1194 domain-containing protein [Sinirhodobacter populi]